MYQKGEAIFNGRILQKSDCLSYHLRQPKRLDQPSKKARPHSWASFMMLTFLFVTHSEPLAWILIKATTLEKRKTKH